MQQQPATGSVQVSAATLEIKRREEQQRLENEKLMLELLALQGGDAGRVPAHGVQPQPPLSPPNTQLHPQLPLHQHQLQPTQNSPYQPLPQQLPYNAALPQGQLLQAGAYSASPLAPPPSGGPTLPPGVGESSSFPSFVPQHQLAGMPGQFIPGLGGSAGGGVQQQAMSFGMPAVSPPSSFGPQQYHQHPVPFGVPPAQGLPPAIGLQQQTSFGMPPAMMLPPTFGPNGLPLSPQEQQWLAQQLQMLQLHHPGHAAPMSPHGMMKAGHPPAGHAGGPSPMGTGRGQPPRNVIRPIAPRGPGVKGRPAADDDYDEEEQRGRGKIRPNASAKGASGAGARPKGANRGRGGYDYDDIGSGSEDEGGAPQKKRSQIPDGPPLQVLVFGETGAGKSTFINMLTNYFRGGSLDNLKVAIPTSFLRPTEREFRSTESNTKNRAEAQTSECTDYKFRVGPNRREFIIIDSPGLSDPRGMQKDDENLDLIIKAAEEADNLAALVFVINGSVARRTNTLNNVITRFRGAIPDVVLDNVVIAFTNCWKHDRNFDPAVLGRFARARQFHTKNSAFSTNPDSWDDATRRLLQSEWDMAMEEIDRLVQHIASLAATSTAAFKDMRENRDKIKAVLHKARLEISQLQQLQDEIAAVEAAMDRYGNDADQFKDYTRQQIITQKVLVDASYHSTICSTCNVVCHDNCGLDEIGAVGSTQFLSCYAFGGNPFCRQCEGHDHTTHYHDKKTMIEDTKTLEEVLYDVKAKYDAAQQGQANSKQKLTTVQGAKDAIEQAITQMADEVRESCDRLKSVCSGFNLVDELYVMLGQLETEARALQSMDARKSAEDFIRTIRLLCDSLESGGGGNKKQSSSSSKQQQGCASYSSSHAKGSSSASSAPAKKVKKRFGIF